MKDLFYFSYINHTLRSKDIKNIFTRQTIIRDVKQSVISYNKSWILPCQGTFIVFKIRTSIMTIEYWLCYNYDFISFNNYE
jgi:hypothetical protein